MIDRNPESSGYVSEGHTDNIYRYKKNIYRENGILKYTLFLNKELLMLNEKLVDIVYEIHVKFYDGQLWRIRVQIEDYQEIEDIEKAIDELYHSYFYLLKDHKESS